MVVFLDNHGAIALKRVLIPLVLLVLFDKDLIIQTGDKIKSFSEKEREFDKFVLSKGNEFSLLGFFLKKKV